MTDSELAARQIEILTKNGLYTYTTTGHADFVVDSAGNIFHPNNSAATIVKIDTTGSVTTFAGGVTGLLDGTGTNARFQGPSQIAIDSSDNLYVYESQGTIRKITPGAVVTTLYTYAGNLGAYRLAADSGGTVYTIETLNGNATHTIKKIVGGVASTLAGSGSTGFTNGTGAGASFNTPTGIAVDSVGNVYVSDTGNFVIRKITAAGVVTTFAGSGTQGILDGTSSVAKFYFYSGLGPLTFDRSGNLIVGDPAGSVGYVRKIDAQGVTTTLCGGGALGGTATNNCADSTVWVNAGLAVGPTGSIYSGGGSVLYRFSP